MTITTTALLTSSLIEIGALGVTDTLADSNTASECLKRLNGYLNGLNARGAVFPNVALAIGDTLPIADEHEDDLRLAMAKRLAPLFGKQLDNNQMSMMYKADARFVAAHITVSPATIDAALLTTASQRRV
jgi:hypothetical protein